MLLSAPAAVLSAEYEFGATIEADYLRSKTETPTTIERESDFFAATVEATGKVTTENDYFARFTLLAEDIGHTDFNEFRPSPGMTEGRPSRLHFEEAVIGKKFGNHALEAGMMVLPFGSYETAGLNDTVALELGETISDLAIGVSNEYSFGTINTYAFFENHRDSAKSDNGFMISGEFPISENHSIGGGYLSVAQAQNDAPGLANAFVRGGYDKYGINYNLEYVTATERQFGLRPEAVTAEVAKSLPYDLTAALKLQATDDFNILPAGDGEYRSASAILTWEPIDSLMLGVEYTRARELDTDYNELLARVAIAY